jgi:hypothetical protein
MLAGWSRAGTRLGGPLQRAERRRELALRAPLPHAGFLAIILAENILLLVCGLPAACCAAAATAPMLIERRTAAVRR